MPFWSLKCKTGHPTVLWTSQTCRTARAHQVLHLGQGLREDCKPVRLGYMYWTASHLNCSLFQHAPVRLFFISAARDEWQLIFSHNYWASLCQSGLLLITHACVCAFCLPFFISHSQRDQGNKREVVIAVMQYQCIFMSSLYIQYIFSSNVRLPK